MAVQAKCDEKKQVVFVLLCGQFPSQSARRMRRPRELFMTARSKSLGHPAALKSHPSKNEGWGTRPLMRRKQPSRGKRPSNRVCERP